MAEIELTRGDLLKANSEALVNTVNCVGVMGKGVALQFKRAFPDNFRAYKRACDTGDLQPGRMLVVERPAGAKPHYIINFPTKVHWKGDSRLQWIRSGMAALVDEVKARGIRSIAVPPLGCGNGGLDWADVRPIIEGAFATVPGLHVLLFEPAGAPAPDAMGVGTRKPRLTRSRAILIRLLRAYELIEGQLTKLEVQKLAYFLQSAGEPLRLEFQKHKYGPYAEKLNFVLQDMEGHYLRGYGDRTEASRLAVMPAAVAGADELLARDRSARQRLERVRTLIDGFETPYGMELLATVHWVACRHAAARQDLSAAMTDVSGWSARKARYPATHVTAAWRRLSELGWFDEMSGCDVSSGGSASSGSEAKDTGASSSGSSRSDHKRSHARARVAGRGRRARSTSKAERPSD